MPFAFAPVKSELDPIRLAGAIYTQELQRQAKINAEAIELQQSTKALIEHTIDQMDAHRFRIAYALGKPADAAMRSLMLDDFTITLAAEEADNNLDRTRRHILMHGIAVLMRLTEGMPVTLAHVNGIQVAAEMAMKILPHFSAHAMKTAALTLNRLWLDHGVKGAMSHAILPRH